MNKPYHRKYLGPLEADLEKDLDRQMAKAKPKSSQYEELQTWINRNIVRFRAEAYLLEEIIALAITVHKSRTFSADEIERYIVKKVDLL